MSSLSVVAVQGPSVRLAPHQVLAAAVLHQALIDGRSRVATRQALDAQRFLRNADAVQFWCEIAGISPKDLTDRVATGAPQRRSNIWTGAAHPRGSRPRRAERE